MNALAILAMFVATYIHQGIAKRIPASGPYMWGRQEVSDRFFKGKVVGKEDDHTAVYFQVEPEKKVYTIINDENFFNKLVPDINPHPHLITLESEVLAEYPSPVNCKPSYCRHTAIVKKLQYSYRNSRYYVGLSAWRDDHEKAKLPKWIQYNLLPFTTSDLNQIRPIGKRRSALCEFFNPGCKKNEKCVLFDDLLPHIGCKAINPAPTSKPATFLPSTAALTTLPPTPLLTLQPATPSPPPPPTHSPPLPLATDVPITTVTPITDDLDQELNKLMEQTDNDEELDMDSLWTLVLPVAVGCIVLVSVIVICVVKRRRKGAKSSDEESRVTKTERRKKRRRRDDHGNDHKTSDRRTTRKDGDNRGAETEGRRKRRRRRDQ